MNAFERIRISRRQMLVSLPALAMLPRAFRQTANPPIRAIGINHVTLSVLDVKRSTDFYQGLFGMPVIRRRDGWRAESSNRKRAAISGIESGGHKYAQYQPGLLRR